MNLKSCQTSATLLTFIAVMGAAAAGEPATMPAVSRVWDVSLTDLNLSTPAGVKAARERLRAMAQRVCTQHADGPMPNFAACVESTLAGALRQVGALKQINATARHAITRAASVSLADLDLSTPEGSSAAHERLEATARRLCSELARDHELTYQPDFATCVHDALTGAWAQANVIRAATDTRTAQRAKP